MCKDKMKRYFLLLGIVLPSILFAQNVTIKQYMRQMEQNFNNYEIQQQLSFEKFRNRINAEFAEYMRQAWPEYKSEPAKPVPDSPEPPTPIIKDPDIEPSNDPIPFDDVMPALKPIEPPQPVVPLPKPELQPVTPNKPTFSFTFYGQECKMPLENRHRFNLSGVDENKVADGWKILSSDIYLPVIAKCLDYRDKLHLCDWGYMRFVEKMTTTFFSSTQLNEARLMQMYILTQSGYKVRIAQANNRLLILLPSKEEIYKYPYLNIGGNKYYDV